MMHSTVSSKVQKARQLPLESLRVCDRDWVVPETPEYDVAEAYSTSLLISNLCKMS